jgi:hypothetical protein
MDPYPSLAGLGQMQGPMSGAPPMPMNKPASMPPQFAQAPNVTTDQPMGAMNLNTQLGPNVGGALPGNLPPMPNGMQMPPQTKAAPPSWMEQWNNPLGQSMLERSRL